MTPEFVPRILDELDERNQQAPRVRAVDDETFEEHASDLLLDNTELGLREQVQNDAREVMRVAVRVSELVRDGIHEEVAAFHVQGLCELLEQFHRRALRNAARSIFAAVRLNGLNADVQDERVEQRNVVLGSRRECRRRCESESVDDVLAQVLGLTSLEVRVHFLTQRRRTEGVIRIGVDSRSLLNFRKQVHL